MLPFIWKIIDDAGFWLLIDKLVVVFCRIIERLFANAVVAKIKLGFVAFNISTLFVNVFNPFMLCDKLLVLSTKLSTTYFLLTKSLSTDAIVLVVQFTKSLSLSVVIVAVLTLIFSHSSFPSSKIAVPSVMVSIPFIDLLLIA